MESNKKTPRFYLAFSLIFLIGIYMLLSLSGITKSITNQEAENYRCFSDFLTKASPSPLDTNKTLVQTIYFYLLSFWSNFFGASLITYRSFSFFCGGLIILSLFFFFRNKFTLKTTTLILSVLTFNPFFIQISQQFTSYTAQILIAFLLLFCTLRIFKIFFKKELISKKETLFSVKSPIIFLSMVISILILVMSSTFQSLAPEKSVRKIITAIYQTKTHKTDPGEQGGVTFLVFDQDYSLATYVENQLIAKELHETPLRLQWHEHLDQFIPSGEVADFWQIKYKGQSTSPAFKDLKNFRETDQITLEDYSAIHFQKIKSN